jgi:ribonuclease P protein component
MRRLIKRAQFLKAARGTRASRRGFVVQMAASTHHEPGLGFTVTRRTGNAVVRNRIKRRLLAAAAANAEHFAAGHDYVLIGRREALHEPFGHLVGGIRAALSEVTAPKAGSETQGQG